MIKKCVICGIDFEYKNNRKTCGKECLKERHRRRDRERYANHPEYRQRRRGVFMGLRTIKNCVICGNYFEAKKCSKTCSLECSKENTRKRRRKWTRERCANDPEYRERQRQYERELYANNPEYRERTLERDRERWDNDPEYRERKYERNRERYANNPEYRERRQTRERERYYEKQTARNFSDFVIWQHEMNKQKKAKALLNRDLAAVGVGGGL